MKNATSSPGPARFDAVTPSNQGLLVPELTTVDTRAAARNSYQVNSISYVSVAVDRYHEFRVMYKDLRHIRATE